MRAAFLPILVFGGLVAACSQPLVTGAADGKVAGRYSGIGTYSAGRMWSRQVIAASAADPAAATLADDEHIIVVVDGHTGEIRQCGDQSGFCVTMNPWSGPASATLPAKLKVHAAELNAQEDAVASPAAKSAPKPK